MANKNETTALLIINAIISANPAILKNEGLAGLFNSGKDSVLNPSISTNSALAFIITHLFQHHEETHSWLIKNLLQLIQSKYNGSSLEIIPFNSSIFYYPNGSDEKSRSIFFPLEHIGSEAIFDERHFSEKIDLIQKIIGDNKAKYTLIDVGANIGLFSRSCISKFPQINKIFCYEPDKNNFSLLKRNLKFFKKLNLNRYGISNTSGVAKLYLNDTNCGAHSLRKPPKEFSFRESEITLVSGNTEQRKWLKNASCHEFIYKSDTEGHDLKIAESIGFEFWRKSKLVIFEISPSDSENVDQRFLRELFDGFIHKLFLTIEYKRTIGSNTATIAVNRISKKTDEIIEFLESNKKEFVDLIMWN